MTASAPDLDAFSSSRRIASASAGFFEGSPVFVAIPPGTHLEIRQTAGTATLNGRFADVDVSVRAGDIHASFPKKTIKQLDARTILGQVETNFPDETVTREGLFPGGTHYEGGQGDSTVRLHTRAGKIKVELFEAP